MDGSNLAFTAANAYVEMNYQGVAGSRDMTEGAIDIWAERQPYEVVDVAANNIDYSDPIYNHNCGFLCGGSHVLSGINLGGGRVNADGSITIDLAGIPAVITSWTDVEMAATTIDIFGFTALQYQAGTITLSEVPLPAAAWLFGSALLGLSTLSRRR